MKYPERIPHWINDQEVDSASGETYPKFDPHTGKEMGRIAQGDGQDARAAVASAENAFEEWSSTNIITRANILRKAVQLLEADAEEIAEIVALETGKPMKDARGEVGAAVECGYFMAGEGRRYFGFTTTSAVPNRTAALVRAPLGVSVLIIAANTPIPNVAWKAFPALLCGNSVVMKASEDIPLSVHWCAKLFQRAGVPAGVFNVIQGEGKKAGSPLVEDERVQLVSFTGSVGVGRTIQRVAGERLARVCLELGGKNPLVVCDDADLESAANFAVASAFSNAGQRCASGSRMVVFDAVYDEFKAIFLEKTKQLKLGNTDAADLGPVINERQLNNMLAAIEKEKQAGATVLIGGGRATEPGLENGYYMTPTILENVARDGHYSCTELFGPITGMYRVKDFQEALDFVNSTPFGLTAAIHTRNVHRVQVFTEKSRSGVVSINGPTHGSEPHMPFGGMGQSGTGWREPGVLALDVYSEWKTVYNRYEPGQV